MGDLEPLRCKCCGGPYNPNGNRCDYCGTWYRQSTDAVARLGFPRYHIITEAASAGAIGLAFKQLMKANL